MQGQTVSNARSRSCAKRQIDGLPGRWLSIQKSLRSKTIRLREVAVVVMQQHRTDPYSRVAWKLEAAQLEGRFNFAIEDWRGRMHPHAFLERGNAVRLRKVGLTEGFADTQRVGLRGQSIRRVVGRDVTYEVREARRNRMMTRKQHLNDFASDLPSRQRATVGITGAHEIRKDIPAMSAAGEPFDHNLHEAIFQQPTPGVEVDTIADVVETGYKLGSTLVRAAKVVVAVPE